LLGKDSDEEGYQECSHTSPPIMPDISLYAARAFFSPSPVS
jgi:hypothetical protein